MRSQLLRFVRGAAGLSLLVAGMGAIGGLGIDLTTGGGASAAGPAHAGTYICTAGLPATAHLTLHGTVQDEGTAPATLHIGTTYTVKPQVKLTVTGKLLSLAAENGEYTLTVLGSKLAMVYTGFTGATTALQTGTVHVTIPAPWNTHTYWYEPTGTKKTVTTLPTGLPPSQSPVLKFSPVEVTMAAASGVTAKVTTLDLKTKVVVTVKCHPTNYSKPVSFGTITTIKSAGAAAPLAITTTSPLPSGRVGSHYSTTLVASGGTGTYTWAETGLPAGLSIDKTTGVISGTPTATGTFKVHATVTDGAKATASKTLTLTITPPPPLVITTTSLPGGTVGKAYSATVVATGGETPYTWSATTLPTGLTITAGTGKISGTPTKTGTFTSVVTVKGTTETSKTKTLPIKVTPAPLAITTTSLPGGVVTVHYTTSLKASGGTGTYTWSATGLATGLTVTAGTGKVSGTPTKAGTFTVKVTVKDTAGKTASKTLSLKIAPGLAITTSSLPGGTVGTAYSATVKASGGETPYTWSATALPPGLAVTAGTGKISGTPTKTGTFTTVVTVKGTTGVSKTRKLPIKVTPAPLEITTTSLPSGIEDVPYYTATLEASGGTGTYTWSATGLPSGLTVTAGTGKISGTPTETGTFTVKVTVKDTAGKTASKTLSLKIGPALVITTTSLPGGTVGTAYSATVVASGGETPYTWSAFTLPTGLSITAHTGVISGTPTKAGTFTIVVTVKGATGRTFTATFTITIAKQPLAITTTGLPSGTVTVAYSATLNAVGGTTPYAWSATTLPPGLTLTAKGTVTGKMVKVSGTPTTAGKYTVKVKVTGKTKATATATFSLTIATVPPPVKPTGYWMVASDGGMFSFGTAHFHGSMGGMPLNKPIVGMAATPTGGGYWEVASDGGIFSFGNATFYGSMGGQPLNQPIVGIAAAPTGKGYWEVASDGGIFSFGTATFQGSMGGTPLNKPIVGIAATPTGGGYWEVASDGGIFSFGTATFQGSMGGMPLNEPIVGIAATPTGGGYWEVASDGGIFSFGAATFQGSMGGQPLNEPIVGMAAAT